MFNCIKLSNGVNNQSAYLNVRTTKPQRGRSQEALYDQKYTKSWEWLAIFMYAVLSEFILPVSSYSRS